MNSFGHTNGLFKGAIIYVLFNMALVTFGVEKRRDSLFYRVDTTGREEELELLSAVPSWLTCAYLCLSHRDSSSLGTTQGCVGVQFDQNTMKCRLLSAGVNWTPSTVLLGAETYRKDPLRCDSEGFQVVNVSGANASSSSGAQSQVCLGYFNTMVNYTVAKDHCLDMDGHLMHLDTESKFQAARALLADKSQAFPWVGVTDSDLEGHWVYELTGQPLTPEAGSHWNDGEPNNGIMPNMTYDPKEEDCGHIINKTVTSLNDIECSTHLTYICELQ